MIHSCTSYAGEATGLQSPVDMSLAQEDSSEKNSTLSDTCVSLSRIACAVSDRKLAL